MQLQPKYVATILFLFLAGYGVSRFNYLIFHSFGELFSVSVAFCTFIIAWNSRRTTSLFFTTLGFNYLAYAIIIMFHLLAYRGMNVFPSHPGANTATQFWIGATWINALGFPLAFLTFRRRLPQNLIALLFTTAVIGVIGSIFLWRNFPDCFVEGTGLTPFKVASEYLISCVYGLSIWLLHRERGRIDKVVYERLRLSLVLSIATEMMFTLYADPYGLTNFLGHGLRILSTFMMYRAVVETAFLQPYALVFRDLKLTKERIQEEKDFAAAIFNTAGGFLAVTDIAGNIERCSDATLKLIGVDEEELLGQPFARIAGSCTGIDPEDVRERVRTGATVRFESVVTRQENRILIDWVASPLMPESGDASHIIFVGSDVTERKNLEMELALKRDEAMEASRLKSSFLATMSHEIRTPMNGIIGMTDLLIDTRLDARQRDMALVVKDSANALLNIINDILDFSKIEADRMEIESADFALLPVIEGVAEILAAKARDKGIGLVTHVDPGIPARIVGDPTRLRQILLNLAGNGIKFTDSGEVSVSARLEVRNVDAIDILFEVRDSGIGISTEGMARLFEPFVQLDVSPSRRHNGTGLGLAICKRLVEIMGGKIEAESRIGEGSVFRFRLAFRVAHAPVFDDPPFFTGLSVLVVFESAVAASAVTAYLRSWGIRAETIRREEWITTGYPMRDCDILIIEGHSRLLLPELVGARVLLISDAFEEDSEGPGRISLLKPFRQSHLFDALSRLLGNGCDHYEETGSEASIEVASTEGSSGHILVAEDNAVNQQVVLLQLRKLGYTTCAVATGEEVLQALAEDSYDLVLMDCQMPVMDGYEATRRIRENEKTTGKKMPVIAITANAMKEDRALCLAAGMDDYVSKPVQPDQLKIVLERHVQAREALPAGTLPAQPSAAEILKLDYLLETFSDDPEAVEELLRIYLETTPQLLDDCRAAVTAGDHQRVARITHQLKSSSASVGAVEMSKVAADLERSAHGGEWGGIHALFEILEGLFSDTRNAIQAHLV